MTRATAPPAAPPAMAPTFAVEAVADESGDVSAESEDSVGVEVEPVDAARVDEVVGGELSVAGVVEGVVLVVYGEGLDVVVVEEVSLVISDVVIELVVEMEVVDDTDTRAMWSPLRVAGPRSS